MSLIYKALCFDVAQGRMNGAPMGLELTRVNLLLQFANRYTARGAQEKNVILTMAFNFYG